MPGYRGAREKSGAFAPGGGSDTSPLPWCRRAPDGAVCQPVGLAVAFAFNADLFRIDPNLFSSCWLTLG